MKKNYFFTALALCGLLTFTSCGNDDDPISEGPNTEIAAGDQVIVLDMQDTDVLSTKSRPLYSADSKGADQVTDVQLFLFGYNKTSDQYEFVKLLPAINNWNNNSNDYNYGRKKIYKLEGENKLKDSNNGGYDKYIIYAVGQDESNENSIPKPFKIAAENGEKLVKALSSSDWTAKSKWSLASNPGKGFVKTVALGPNDVAGEIFSGVSKPIEFTIASGFSTTVLLKRQVAGVLGYFNNIPAYGENNDTKPVTSIRLVASNKNNNLDLTTLLDVQNDDATFGEQGYKETEYVINGFNINPAAKDAWFGKGEAPVAKNAYTVYEIDLKKWYAWDAGNKTWKEDAIINSTELDKSKQLLGFKNDKGWHNAIDPSNSSILKVDDGAVFGSNFVIPFEKNDMNTFELQLISDKEGNKPEVVRTWTVKLDENSRFGEDKDKTYSIYRNHLYQVGRRGSGDTPDKPGKDPDKPQSLDKDQELIIKINDQWEFVHNMEID